MELRDYLAALRRNWAVWVGVTLLGALSGALAMAVTPPTYQASAQVFASVSPSIPNSAQFVGQRSKSYPGVVVSESVLAPVIDELDLDVPVRELRGRVSATNPEDTSQVVISVRGDDPAEVATIADAVAEQFTDVVEELETPASGDRPVELTVTDPADEPSTPVAPVASNVVGLGMLVGLFLGLAGAVVRSRLDTAVHTPEDVELAWDGEPVEVVSSAAGRARHSRLAGRPAAVLARRLETAAELRPLRVVLVCPAPTEGTVARRLAADVAADLVDRGVDAAVGRAARVRLEVGDPLAPARVWREAAGRRDDVVLVVPSGRVASVELREVRRTLRDAGLRPLALVLVGRATRPAATGGTASNAEAREVPVARGARPDGVVAGSSPGGAPTAFPAQR